MRTRKKRTNPLNKAVRAETGRAGGGLSYKGSLLAVAGLVAIALLTKAALSRRSIH